MMHTIKASADIDSLFKDGRRGTSRLTMVLACQTPKARDLTTGRVLFVAGKKLGNAVHRNRCKRVLRELCRSLGGPWPGLDVALIARRGLAEADQSAVRHDLEMALQKAKVAECVS